MCRCTALRSGLLVLLVGGVLAAPGVAEEKKTKEWWKGVVDVPGMKLDIVVAFEPGEAAGQYTARITIPVQAFLDQPLVDVTYTDAELKFTIAQAGAVFEAARAPDGRTAKGVLKQVGMEFPLTMERITEAEAAEVGPPRPQTPKPPFPYTVSDVTYENPADGTQLAGTLTIPTGAGPHPAVILISGSGPQDRDETLFGHKPFLVLADHLTRHGIAVLRYDDRGVGGSSGATMEATTKDFANDVLAGVVFLKKLGEIDKERIGLVGHSEGGIVAPLAASRSKSVRCVVLLSGTALPGDEILRMQTEALLRAAGVPEATIKEELAAHGRLMEVLGGDDEELIRTRLRELTDVQMNRVPGPARPTAAQMDELVAAAMKELRSPWMQSFLKLDPREALRLMRCPVLALGGEKDLQVPPDKNLPEIEKTLREAGNSDVTVKTLPNLNHMFQEATTGLVGEYGLIEQTLAPQALDEVTNWLRAQFGLK